MDGRTERVCSTYADGQDEDRGARPECHPIQNTPVGEASVRPSVRSACFWSVRLTDEIKRRGRSRGRDHSAEPIEEKDTRPVPMTLSILI